MFKDAAVRVAQEDVSSCAFIRGVCLATVDGDYVCYPIVDPPSAGGMVVLPSDVIFTVRGFSGCRPTEGVTKLTRGTTPRNGRGCGILGRVDPANV